MHRPQPLLKITQYRAFVFFIYRLDIRRVAQLPKWLVDVPTQNCCQKYELTDNAGNENSSDSDNISQQQGGKDSTARIDHWFASSTEECQLAVLGQGGENRKLVLTSCCNETRAFLFVRKNRDALYLLGPSHIESRARSCIETSSVSLPLSEIAMSRR